MRPQTPVPPAPTPQPTATPTSTAPTATPQAQASPTATPTPTGSPTAIPVNNTQTYSLTLEIEGLSDESIVRGDSIIARGQTTADAIVSINGVIVPVDETGYFEVPLKLDPGPNQIEVVASDLDGMWIVIWDTLHPTAEPPSATPDSDLFFARTVNNGDSWTSMTLIHAANDADDGGADIAVDGYGNWVVVWSSFQDTLGETFVGGDMDIFASTWNEDVTSWTLPVLLNSTGTSDWTAADDKYAHIHNYHIVIYNIW